LNQHRALFIRRHANRLSGYQNEPLTFDIDDF
jgi:hypothetical protein